MAKGKKQIPSPEAVVAALGGRKNLNKGDANKLIRAQLALKKLEAEAAVPVAVSNTIPMSPDDIFGMPVTDEGRAFLNQDEDSVPQQGDQACLATEEFEAPCGEVVTEQPHTDGDTSGLFEIVLPRKGSSPLGSPSRTYANGVDDPRQTEDLASERPTAMEVDTPDEHATEAEPEWEPAANTTLPLQGGDAAVVAGHTDEQLFNALSVFTDGNQPQDARWIAFVLLVSTFTHPKAMLEHPVAAQLFFAHVLKSVETLAEQESKDDPSSPDLRATVTSMFGKRAVRLGIVLRSLGLPESTDNDNFSSDFLQLVCQDLKHHSLVQTPLRTAQVDNESKTQKHKSLLKSIAPDGTISLLMKFFIDALTQLTPLAMPFAGTDESRAGLVIRMSIQLAALEAALAEYESHKDKPKGRKSTSYVTMITAQYCDPEVTLVETGNLVKELAVKRTQLVTAITGALVAILGRDNLSEQMQAEIVSNVLGEPSPMAEIQGDILSQKEVKRKLHCFAQVFAPATDGATVFFSGIESAFSKFAKFLGNANLGDDVVAIAHDCIQADEKTQAERLRYALSMAQQKSKDETAEAVIAEGEPVAVSQQPKNKKRKGTDTRVKSGSNGNKLNNFVAIFAGIAGAADAPIDLTGQAAVNSAEQDSDDEPIRPRKENKNKKPKSDGSPPEQEEVNGGQPDGSPPEQEEVNGGQPDGSAKKRRTESDEPPPERDAELIDQTSDGAQIDRVRPTKKQHNESTIETTDNELAQCPGSEISDFCPGDDVSR